MKRFLKALPVPLCGLALGFSSLGNLLMAVMQRIFGLKELGMTLHAACGWITLFLLAILLLKFIFDLRDVLKMLENPEMAGIFSTYSLTLMIFAGYLPDYVGKLPAEIFWWTGVLVHYTNMVIFTYRYVYEHFEISQLLPPWYIVYVGFALVGFNSADYAPHWFGIAAFWVGIVCFTLIFVMLLRRSSVMTIPRMYEPTLCINAAIGITLTTYVRSFTHPWAPVIFILYFASLIIWIWIIFHLPKWLSLPFYPSDAAFSFPFVVSAIASMEAMRTLMEQKIMISSWNTPIVLIQTAVAVIMVLLTACRFLRHIIRSLLHPETSADAMSMMDMARGMDGKTMEQKKMEMKNPDSGRMLKGDTT